MLNSALVLYSYVFFPYNKHKEQVTASSYNYVYSKAITVRSTQCYCNIPDIVN